MQKESVCGLDIGSSEPNRYNPPNQCLVPCNKVCFPSIIAPFFARQIAKMRFFGEISFSGEAFANVGWLKGRPKGWLVGSRV